MQPGLSDESRSLRELVAAWREHSDEAAARELMTRLYPQVIAIVRRHLPRRAADDDLTQDIFVKLFAQLGRYDPALPLENWVSRLALNVCLDQLRAQRRRPELLWADLSEESLTALFSMGAVCGAIVTTRLLAPPMPITATPPPEEKWRKLTLADYEQRLALTLGQFETLKPIFGRTGRKLATLRSNTTERVAGLIREMNSEVMPELSAEQQARLKQLLEERRQKPKAE